MDRSSRPLSLIPAALLICLSFLVADSGEAAVPLPVRPSFTQIATDEGLSQVTVYVAFQDHHGFLWFGTQDGLNRWDGFNVQVFRHVPFDSDSLSHNRIFEIAEDREGTLWVGTQNGLNRFDSGTETFSAFLGGRMVEAILEDSSGRFWVGTRAGLLLFDRASEAVRPLAHASEQPAALIEDWVAQIFEDSKRRIWVATWGGGLLVLEPGEDRFTAFYADPSDPYSLSDDTATALAEDADGRLWVGGISGVSVLDPVRGRFDSPAGLDLIALEGDTRRVQSLLIDTDGVVWVGTANGLVVYDPGTTSRAVIRRRPGDPTSLRDDTVFDVIQDTSGQIWIGTLGGGACRLNTRHSSFGTYRHDPLDSDSLAGDFVYAFHEDTDGILWVGTDSGLDRLDRRAGRFTHRRHDPDDPTGLPSDLVRSIHRDRSGTLWVAAIGGLVRFDPDAAGRERTRLYRPDPDDRGSLRHRYVYVVFEARDGVMWVGSAGGLQALRVEDRAAGRFTAFPVSEESKNRPVRAIRESADGTLWVGTYGGGLERVHPKRGRLRSHRHDPSDPSSISTDYVYSVLEDSQQRVWVGTYGGGLNLLLPEHREDGRFLHLFASHGLPSDLVYGILEDESGDLWVSTTNGLCRLHIEGEIGNDLASSVELRRFDRADGLQNTEFNAGAFERLRSGELAFGGVSGLTIFDPSTIGISEFRPPVELTGLRIFSQPVAIAPGSPLPASLSELDTLELSYRHRVFTLEFSALDFTNPAKNRYAFRLDGFDDDWMEVGADRRSATYTGLAPGSYRFRVKATNSDGLWTSQERTLRVVIVPPFWQTWWFRLGSVLVGIMAVIAGWKWRVRDLSRQRDRLEKEVAARTLSLEAVTQELESANKELDSFASSVSHDLRSPLRSMRGFSTILLEDHADELSPDAREVADRIDAAVQRMEQLIEALLTMSRMSRKPLDVVDLDLSNLAEDVVDELRSVEPERSVDVEIEVGLIDRGDETLIESVLENLLANAWKFTSNRDAARIRFARDAEESTRFGIPVYIVEDNGAGFDMRFAENLFKPFSRLHRMDEFAGTGVGLATVQRIVDRHGGRIWAVGKVDEGAEIRFTLRSE